MSGDASSPESHRGVFTSTQQLDSYERLWHHLIYQPVRHELREKVRATVDL